MRDSEADKKDEADKKAAEAVAEEVSKLPATDKLTVKNEAEVKAAREAFDKLTANQKKLATEAEKTLKAAEAKIAELKGEQPAEEKLQGTIISKFGVKFANIKLTNIKSSEITKVILDEKELNKDDDYSIEEENSLRIMSANKNSKIKVIVGNKVYNVVLK